MSEVHCRTFCVASPVPSNSLPTEIQQEEPPILMECILVMTSLSIWMKRCSRCLVFKPIFGCSGTVVLLVLTIVATLII